MLFPAKRYGVPSIVYRALLTLLCPYQDTIGYNMAALRQINRQQKTSKINEFYETEGFENADRLQAHLDESTKKRKRAVVKA